MRHEKCALMIAWIIYMAILIILTGCGTRKSTETSETNRQVSIDRIESGRISGLSISRDSILSQLNIKAMIDEIVWAPPDSSGRIYPQKTTRYNIDLTRTEKGESSDSTTIADSREIQSATTGSETKYSVSDIESDTRLLPMWVIAVILMVIISMVYYVYRKNKGGSFKPP